MSEDNLEKQIPLILYRLDTTAKVLEEIKQVLDRQTENLTSLLVLQEKHNNLQMVVSDLRQEIDKLKAQIEKSSTFVDQFYTGLYICVFLFGILQSILGWWAVDTHDQLVSLKEQENKISTQIEILSNQKK